MSIDFNRFDSVFKDAKTNEEKEQLFLEAITFLSDEEKVLMLQAYEKSIKEEI